jgi:hypothetical protein
MNTSFRWLPVLILVVACASQGLAASGSPILIEVERQIGAARKDPVAVKESFYSDKPGRERFIALMLLLRLHSEKLISDELYRTLVDDALVDVEGEIRGTAVHYLPTIHDGEDLQDRYRRCTLDKGLLARYNAAERLAAHPSEKSLPYLAALLGDESIEVRDRAASSLCQWKSPNVKHVFLKALKDSDVRRAGCAARVLFSVYGYTPEIDVLNQYLDSELDKAPPLAAADNTCLMIRCLARTGHDSSIAVIEEGYWP